MLLQMVTTSLPIRTGTRTCFGPFEAEVEAPGASSLRPLTKRTPPRLSLSPFCWPTPPTPTQPRTYLLRSSVSPPRLLSKVTVDIVVYLQARFNSPSYRPTSQPKRPRPHSFRCSNLRPRSQVSPFKTLLRSSKISGACMSPYSPSPESRPGSRSRLHPGCCRRISLILISPKIWPRNCSRLHLISGTRESFPQSRERANLDPEGFISAGLSLADRFPVWIPILWDLTLLGEIVWPL